MKHKMKQRFQAWRFRQSNCSAAGIGVLHLYRVAIVGKEQE